jgi:hypothetical protein
MMSDKSPLFDPETIRLIEFKMLKGRVEEPEDFVPNGGKGYSLENSLQLSFNLEQQLVKADFTIEIKCRSKNNKVAAGNFHLVFVYHIENLSDLTKQNKNQLIEPDPQLTDAISFLTYSTSRGALLIRLQGTALQNFILPVTNTGNQLVGG